MSETEKRFTSVMLVIFIFTFIILTIQSVFTEHTGIIPISGLSASLHMLIFVMIWPIFGSTLLVVVTPRILAPVYLKLKEKIMPNFKNGQIEYESNPQALKKWFTRALIIGLLVLGIQAALFSFIPYDAFLSPEDFVDYTEASVDIRFILGVSTAVVGLLTPIAVAILSVGWSLEDAGLVHFDIPKDSKRIYEIEPIFRRYNSYVKGYAGLSALLFLFAIVVYFAFVPGRLIDAIVTLILPLTTILSTSLAYYVYVKTNTSFLRGKYPILGQVTEENLLS